MFYPGLWKAPNSNKDRGANTSKQQHFAGPPDPAEVAVALRIVEMPEDQGLKFEDIDAEKEDVFRFPLYTGCILPQVYSCWI